MKRLILVLGYIASSILGNPGVMATELPSSDDRFSNNAPHVSRMDEFIVDETRSRMTHTLFMGADFAIDIGDKLYPVKSVEGSSWIIEVDGMRRSIPSIGESSKVNVTPMLKLTNVSVTIAGFQKFPTYSYANDPSVLLTKGLSMSASLNSDLLAVSNQAAAKLQVMVSNNMGGMSVLAGSDDQFSAQALMATAQYDGAATHPGKGLAPSSAVPSTTTDTTGAFSRLASTDAMRVNGAIAERAAVAAKIQTNNGNEPAGKIATNGIDAMVVDFDIRSSNAIQEPYVITITKFRAPGWKPGMGASLIYARSIHPIDEHLSHIHLVEDGFPFNYETLDFQVHIYSHGNEIASNIAANRVELSRNEAFEYVLMNYLSEKKHQTLPAAISEEFLPPAELVNRAINYRPNVKIYVLITPDGMENGVYMDSQYKKRIQDLSIESLFRQLRFKPALIDGKPVPGSVTLQLASLLR